MRAWIAILCLTVASVAQAQVSGFKVDGRPLGPNADATVRPGDLFGVDFTLTFTGSPYSGGITVEISLGSGATLLGRTQTSPELTPGCDTGLNARTCTGSISIPVGGAFIVRQGMVFGQNAAGTIPYRIRVLVPTGYSTIVVADETFTFQVVREPQVVPFGEPDPLLQPTGQGGATTAFGLANVGSEPTDVTLAPLGEFYEMDASQFRLEPGARRVVTITGKPQSAGAYNGSIGVTGAGVPSGLSIPVRLLSANRPSSRPVPVPARKRIDTSDGTVDVEIRNQGTGTVRGLFHSDYPWLVPPPGLFTMDGGQSRIATFHIDPSKRSALHEQGTVRTNVRLEYLLESATATGDGRIVSSDSPGTSSTSVQVSSTKANLATPATIPPLGAGEVGLIVPGVGRVRGSVGQFLSDVAIASAQPGTTVDDIRLFYTSSGSSLVSSGNNVSGNFALLFDDILQSVYKEDEKVGTLQIRSPLAASLAVAAGIYNVSADAGNYGTVVPAFRTDRAIAGGAEQLLLTGLRKDASGHTNLYIQEASGASATVEVAWFGANGSALGTTPADVPAWGLAQLINRAPDGTVSARVRRTAGSGRLVAYATPVDRLSGDTWAVADWSSLYAYTPGSTVIIPVAGSVHGAGDSFFRTDVALMNRGTSTASGTLHYIDRTGRREQRVLSIGPGETRLLPDVAGQTFSMPETVGYLRWVPTAGSVAASSRTYTTVAGSQATFGTAAPTLPLSYAIGAGNIRKLSGFDDASIETVQKRTPGSVRTNFGLLEVDGVETTVRVRVRYSFPSQLATAVGVSERNYTLPPNGFILVSNISSAILAERRDNFGDLTNLTAEFEVIGGTGRVIPFLSITDNGTGDSLLRTE